MRRRRAPAVPFEHFQVFTFGSDEELRAKFGTLDAAARAWAGVRDEFLERWDLWGRPEVWWRFEPGVPDDLRSGPAAILTRADAARWARIEAGRRRYLAGIGIDPTPPRRGTPFAGS